MTLLSKFVSLRAIPTSRESEAIYFRLLRQSLCSFLAMTALGPIVAHDPRPTTQDAQRKTHDAFTLLEILIVITIIAILAVTIIPNFIGFDAEARISATKTNLNTLRTRIALYRAKEGEYPSSLNDLLTKTYNDMGVEQPYLEKIPPEMVSSKSGNNSFHDLSVQDDLPGEGGWIYYKEKAKVVVDVSEALDGKWGKAAGEVPSEW